MLFTDSVLLDGKPRLTGAGYLVADAKVARTGIQLYSGAEMGRPDLSVVRVLRADGEVFSEQSMGTFVYKPMTNDHPTEMVDSKNWKRLSIGFVGDTVARDGTFIRVPLTMMDQSAIDEFRSGKCELSVGYTAQIDWAGGVTESGEHYDAQQRDIRVNHVALVDRARAGPQARIGDAWPSTPSSPQPKDSPGMPDNLRVIQVDGISINVTDQGAEAITKLQKQIGDAAASHGASIATRDAEISGLRDAHARDLAAKDGEIAGLKTAGATALEAKDGEIAGLKAAHVGALQAKDGEIAALKAQVPDAVALDALIADRARVFDAARKILGDKADFTGKTAADVRRMAVTHRLGDAQVKDKGDEYISAAFDTLTAVTSPADPVRDALRTTTPPNPTTDRDAPYLAFVKSLETAHLPNGAN